MIRWSGAALLAVAIACNWNVAAAETDPVRTEAVDPLPALRVLDGVTTRQWSVPETGFLFGLSQQATVASYRAAAEAGDIRAQAVLGYSHSAGIGGARDDAEAARWLRLAADRGNAFAQAYLGSLHAVGAGVARSDTEAVRLYRLAADQGSGFGQWSLAHAYEKGLGVSQNYGEAVRLYRLAAVQGSANA